MRRFGAAVAVGCAVVVLLPAERILLRAQKEQAESRLLQFPCGGIADCNRLGRRAVGKGDTGAAISFFKAQVGYAEDAQDKEHLTQAYNNLALAYILENSYFRALSWTRVALRLNPQDKTASGNLKTIQQRVGSYKWPSDVAGTYVQYAGRTQWNSFCVRETKDQKVDFRLLVFRMGLAWRAYGPAAYGDLSGEAVLTQGRYALYKDAKDFPACSVKMQFGSASVSLSQEGDCGFGYGVKAEGNYERITATQGDLKHCGERNLP